MLSLKPVSPVVSGEDFLKFVHGGGDNGRQVMEIAHMAFGQMS